MSTELRPPLFVLRGVALVIDVFVANKLLDAAVEIRDGLGIEPLFFICEATLAKQPPSTDLEGMMVISNASIAVVDQVVAFAALLVLFLGQTWCGYTIGKLCTFSRVVDAETNGSIRFLQALGRTLCLPIDFLPFAGIVGFTASRRSPMAQRYGDDLAGTRVIQVGLPAFKYAAAALVGPLMTLALVVLSYLIAN